MEPKPRRDWMYIGLGFLGWLSMAVAILAGGDRQNKLDQRAIDNQNLISELDKRLDAVEKQLMER